ncbi:MAG: cell envelope integrity protein TolA [Pseudomonadales bacterium]|nr:cell envelope integrity protein TolA [Pseudomonadales bacterium]MDG2079258.1 cell envelope integrity protein TolA [Pseudomonadales bacterium]
MANSRSYLFPVMITVAMHLALFAVLSNDWAPRAKPLSVAKPIKAVQASLVTLKKEPVKPKVRPKAKPKPVKPKLKPKPAVKPKPVVKEAPKVDLEKQKREREKQAREKVAKEKAAKEQQRLADEQALAAMLDGEDAEMQADDDANLVAQYSAMISQQMHQRWKLPPSARRNMVALVKIRMVPTGDLVTVTIAQSSGNEAFDQSAILAVQKAGRFAFMKNLPGRLFEAHFREFTFRFSPEDLRL